MLATARLNSLLDIVALVSGGIGREFAFARTLRPFLLQKEDGRRQARNLQTGAGLVQRRTGWRAARVSSRRRRGA